MINKKSIFLKSMVDYSPLIVFLITFEIKDLMTATVALIITTLVMIITSLILIRHLPLTILINTIIIGIFGCLTLWFNDETFIKIKPTIIYSLFALILSSSVLLGKPLLKTMLSKSLSFNDKIVWNSMTIRFAIFFMVMAITNEIIRRSFTTEIWILWKVPGSLSIVFLFIVFQIGLIRRI
ncbi:MAG: septation protein IspZ [Rhodospirillaceae bacterium]|jgi:intracellular septation protein|nr:septation protein IspZ [Rhodospirillaceae bacterium]